jgi:hypothetical protein
MFHEGSVFITGYKAFILTAGAVRRPMKYRFLPFIPSDGLTRHFDISAWQSGKLPASIRLFEEAGRAAHSIPVCDRTVKYLPIHRIL